MQTLQTHKAQERKGTLSCIDVANYFLVLANSDGKKITLPALVRLVCIAQGVSLALHDKPLFDEDIEACAYEMIVKDLHENFGNHKACNYKNGTGLKTTKS